MHEEKFVLWPRSWAPGRMAAAQSWQNPSICNIWRKLCNWISFYDRRLPSLTGVYPGTKTFSLGLPRTDKRFYNIVPRQHCSRSFISDLLIINSFPVKILHYTFYFTLIIGILSAQVQLGKMF